MTTDESFLVADGCLCPCHYPPSEVTYCNSCLAVLCKSIKEIISA